MDLINKQEAINEIRLYITAPNISDDETKIEGYGMNDLISRRDLIGALEQKLEDDYFDSYELLKYIKAFPSAEPERKWIPVTEALPINDDWVIVSIYDDNGDTSWQYTTPGFYVPYGKCWIVDNEYCKNVIAWMPLPEPWRGEK